MMGWHGTRASRPRTAITGSAETAATSPHLIRIEADGYQAAVSRDIKSTEGNISIDFELKQGQERRREGRDARQPPRGGGQVALGVAGSQINIKNGDIDDGSTFCAREATDETGRFHFPAQDKDFQLVIIASFGLRSHQVDARMGVDANHPSGAVVPGGRDLPGRKDAGRECADRARCRSPATRTARMSRASSLTHESTTGPDGRFVFERVIPGNGADRSPLHADAWTKAPPR